MGATFTLSSFPPTSAAARQHFYWTYLQVKQWLGRDLPPAHESHIKAATVKQGA